MELIFPLLELQLVTCLALTNGPLANTMQQWLAKALVNWDLPSVAALESPVSTCKQAQASLLEIRGHMEETQGTRAKSHALTNSLP